ncbi:MAG: tryptophan--tRNA ligase [Candidatus Portnoybacteria bacterium]|nr:tryptophan--tRNA ligase [Candidatus Portnoybacteria bacterium]
MASMKRIFSGVQPSGNLHIGNYLGAIKNWAPLANEYDCIYCVVDWHALTVFQKPETLRENTYNALATLLAAGINPEKSIIFIQSHVKEHSELTWILNTVTPLSELEKMTQFKDKARKHKENINAGLLDYPVLMAADILLYDTEAVPVGEDQRQHVELARVVARKFNNLYGETFKEPQEIIRKEAARIMSLSDPSRKMSKSDNDSAGCVNLSDSPDEIRDKFKKAVTDSGKEIRYSPAEKPAISNLLAIYSGFSGKPINEIEAKYKNAEGYAQFKLDLAEIVVSGLADFQKKYGEFRQNNKFLDEVAKTGAEKATLLAEKKMEAVNKRIGLA